MNLTQKLLAWFDQNGRDLPWRVKGGAHFDPYAVWISEIMLQQTTVKTVLDYFPKWMARFPTVRDLAAADLQDVLLAWQGLGYYTRARKIHECARVLTDRYNGVLPPDREALLKLPGIGPYTASSICCFAYNLPETVVDGNVIRVMARLYGLTHAVTKEEIYQLAQKLTPKKQGADYASAIMDLGATVCTPDHPNCAVCPWVTACVARQKGLTGQIPLIRKPTKQERSGQVFLVRNNRGELLIRRRSGKGLLSGLYEFPWVYDAQETPLPMTGNPLGRVVHTFTHFRLTLSVYESQSDKPLAPGDIFVSRADWDQYPFSTLMRKVLRFWESKQD